MDLFINSQTENHLSQHLPLQKTLLHQAEFGLAGSPAWVIRREGWSLFSPLHVSVTCLSGSADMGRTRLGFSLRKCPSCLKSIADSTALALRCPSQPRASNEFSLLALVVMLFP